MPRTAQGPYLYLKPADKKSAATWVVRHNGHILYTRAKEHEADKAKEVFGRYLKTCGAPADPIPFRRFTVKTSARPMVYFVSCGIADFPIKIGYATNVEARLRSIQVSLPFEVKLLGALPGDREKERSLHVAFSHLRMRNEWFRRDPELMKYIEGLEPVDRQKPE